MNLKLIKYSEQKIDLKIYLSSLSFNSKKAVSSDWKSYLLFCKKNSFNPKTLSSDHLISYMDDLFNQKRSLSTVTRKTASLLKIYKSLGKNLTQKDKVRISYFKKALFRNKDNSQRQAFGLNEIHIKKILRKIRNNKKDLRDICLLLLARDLMARRNELISLNWSHIRKQKDGTGICYLSKSKTDFLSKGKYLYVSKKTMRFLKKYKASLDQVKDKDPLFINFRSNSGAKRLRDNSVSNIFKRLGSLSGISPHLISGHSARVGMAQDLVSTGMSLTSIMQAGRWRSISMIARYSEKILLKKGAIAQFYTKVSQK